jgi:hypothetical protein
MYDESLEGT